MERKKRTEERTHSEGEKSNLPGLLLHTRYARWLYRELKKTANKLTYLDEPLSHARIISPLFGRL